MGTVHSATMEAREQLSRAVFFFVVVVVFVCWSQGWNSDSQARSRWQAPLYTEPSHWVRSDLLKRETCLRHSLDIYNREKHFNESSDTGAMDSMAARLPKVAWVMNPGENARRDGDKSHLRKHDR